MDDAETATYVAVSAGGKHYCLHVSDVREIVSDVQVTPVPGGAGGVAGAINVRGRVMALLDLHGLLGGDLVQRTTATALVVDAGLAENVALAVDEVLDVLELTDEERQPPPPFGLGAASYCAAGVSDLEHGLAIVLHLASLLGRAGSATVALGRA